jgi:predicted Zn-dependent peptidase
MYEKIILPNGVRIAAEEIPYVRSASVGIWVGVGSRFEAAKENGASHFIEHMLFKGTATRSAADIAEQFDLIGGQANAFTTKECTCFHVRALDLHLQSALELLCDMFFDSLFDDKDVSNERGVILEEIGMYEDTPEDLVVERLTSAVYRGTPLSRPILGRRSSLKEMDGAFLKDFMTRKYRSGDIIVAMSGSFKDSDIEYLRSRFSVLPKKARGHARETKYTAAFTSRNKRTEQNHICLAFPAPGALSEDRHALQIMNSILGGGMSSRIVQELREKRGLTYSAGSFTSLHDEIGLFCVSAALSPDSEHEALSAVFDELNRFKEGGVTAEELLRVREQIKANILMGLESTSSRMSRIGRSELLFGRTFEPDETIAAYDAVTADTIARLAATVLDAGAVSFSAVGRLHGEDEYRQALTRLR